MLKNNTIRIEIADGVFSRMTGRLSKPCLFRGRIYKYFGTIVADNLLCWWFWWISAL